jgi:hypothetical protein
MKLSIALTILACTYLVTPSYGVPGDSLGNVILPVPGIGVSVANDCNGVIFYTNDGMNTLYKTDKNGTDLGSVTTTDSLTVAPLYFDEMAWDQGRKVLWAQLHNSNPVKVYMLDPTSGIATFAFDSQTNSVGSFRDGLAYDASDDTIWISGDVSSTIEHYSTNGTLLNAITPLNANNTTLGTISGVNVGLGDRLYLGRNGLVEIVLITKTGAFISSFASPDGTRDEGLECDSASFPGLLTLWSRDFYGGIYGIELEPGTCECGGGVQECPPCGKKLNKALVCHVPPGNPTNEHDICISPNAVPAHLSKHEGDRCGPCVPL